MHAPGGAGSGSIRGSTDGVSRRAVIPPADGRAGDALSLSTTPRGESMRLRRPDATGTVLMLLCLMYLITYVDRVNVSTAAGDIRRELSLSNTQLGIVLSAFAYPYTLFQVFGGWLGDRYGARLMLLLCGLIWATATIFTGLAGTFLVLLLARFLLGLGEGATFPTATRAIRSWIPVERRGFAQGITHSFARLGNAVTPPIVAWLTVLVSWRGSFVVLGCLSFAWVVVWYWYFRDEPADHKGITPRELERLPQHPREGQADFRSVPWKHLLRRMLPVTAVYFCYAWTLWIYLDWLPSYFLHRHQLNLASSALFSSSVFFGGVVGDLLGGVISDSILRRTGDLKRSRRDVVLIGLLGSLVFMLPVLFLHDLTAIVLCLGMAFFFAEIVIGPMWSIPTDIAPRYCGIATSVMNIGSPLAAIISPVVFGFVVDRTGNWDLPFIGSIGLLLIGLVLSFKMHPEVPFEDPERPATGIAFSKVEVAN
jgi:MFS family permease